METRYPQHVDRFVELRAQGLPFIRIAEELGISKPTLIKWSRKYHYRIQNLRALEAESLSQQCKVSRAQCVAGLGEDLRRIRDELARRDLSDISTARLFTLAALLRAEANRINGPLQLAEPLSLNPLEDDELDPVISWES